MDQYRFNRRTWTKEFQIIPFPVLFCCFLICLVTMLSSCGRVQKFHASEKNMDYELPDIPEEQKLILYTAHKEDVYRPILQEFEEQTGIYVEVHPGGTTELLRSIRAGEAEGEADIMFGGGGEVLDAYKDCFSPYETSRKEALSPELRSEGNIWTPFTVLPIVFIYNNKLVSRDMAPKSWQEFLTDRWKGTLSFADPARSGTSYTILQTMSIATGKTISEILPIFCHTLDGKLAGGSGDVMQRVESGDMLVGITLEETAMKEIVRGNDISMVYPQEGTSAVPDGAAIIKGAPHRANAEKFIDFMVSEGVQRFAVTNLYRRAVRKDLSTVEKTEGLVILPFDLRKASQEEDAVLEAFRKIWEE